MSRREDEFDRAIKKMMRDHTERLDFTQSMQDAVLKRIGERTNERESKQKWSRFLPNSTKHRNVRWGIISGAAVASLLIFALVWQTHEVSRFGSAGQSISYSPLLVADNETGTASSYASKAAATTTIAASLAPVSTLDIKLSSEAPTLFSAENETLHAPAQSAQNVQQLASQEFTVSCLLQNNSDTPIDGRQLQGMIFLLRQTGGLNPNQAADWEYFVDGPSTIIPAHGAIPWTFTPNPAPPFTSLRDRSVHIVWVFREQNPNFPALYLGTLPIRVSDVRVDVTGTSVGGAPVQFLRVTARLTNAGASSWSMRSALGLLFFPTDRGAALLSRSTYKYFDDIAPVSGNPEVLAPGQSADAQFIITGVPGADMQSLPLTILLVARNEIGS